MTPDAGERLATTRRRVSRLRDWGDTDLNLVAQRALRVAGLNGVLLPLVSTRGAIVMPVVAWDLNRLALRNRSGLGPVLERARVRDLADATASERALSGPVLRVVSFISFTAIGRRRPGLGALAAYAPVLIVRPERSALSEWQVMACDYHGYSVIRGGESSAVLHVRGPGLPPPTSPAPKVTVHPVKSPLAITTSTPVSTAMSDRDRTVVAMTGGMSVAARLLREQLYDVAVRAGQVPPI